MDRTDFGIDGEQFQSLLAVAIMGSFMRDPLVHGMIQSEVLYRDPDIMDKPPTAYDALTAQIVLEGLALVTESMSVPPEILDAMPPMTDMEAEILTAFGIPVVPDVDEELRQMLDE